MEMPNVSNTAYDPKRNTTVDFRAYRKLTENEIRQALAMFLRTPQGRKMNDNQTVTVAYMGD